MADKKNKGANVVQASFGAHKAAPPSDPDPLSANAAASPAGAGSGRQKKPPKAEPKEQPKKTIDWGKFEGLLERFALIYGTDTVWDADKRIIMRISNMAHAHGSDMVRLWKGHPDRRMVDLEQVVFDPTGECDAECLNLFGGIVMQPRKGDVEPLLELMRFLLSRISEDELKRDEILDWLLCWMAYPLQNLGAKLRTAVIMHGDEGAGKNFLFDLLVDIYGKYGALVGQDELEDKFNDWRSGKMMIIGDEVSSRAELVHNKNRLKSLITSPSVQINPKGLPRRTESNHINIVFLSNELQPLALDNSDRRYLVVYTPPMREFDFYRQLKKWRNSGGIAALYHYLLNYDVSQFDPNAPAPWTKHKGDLIDINRKSPERFWAEWHDGLLDLPYQSCAVSQAYTAYAKYCQRIGDRFPLQENVFSRMVNRFSENQGDPVRGKTMSVVDPTSQRKAHRMLLVAEPNFEGYKNEGEWASDTVRKFGEQLRKYTGGGWSGPRSPTEDEQASRGND
jgi:putative DNA primase/helicase